MTHTNTQIIAFVGLAGAGISSSVGYVASKSLPKVYTGGVVYDDMRRHGIEITPESQRAFREEMRAKHGSDYFMKTSIEQMNNLIEAGQKQIVLDGLYTWAEYRLLKREFPGELTVVAIVAPRRLRHRRLAKRPERPFTEQQAMERDWHEIEHMEKGGPIAVADYFITNDGTLEELHQKLDRVLVDELKLY